MNDESQPFNGPVLPEDAPEDGCNCDAKLADIAAALVGVQQKLESVLHAVNIVGQQAQYQTDALGTIVQKVGEFGAQFAGGVNPIQMLKALTGKAKHG